MRVPASWRQHWKLLLLGVVLIVSVSATLLLQDHVTNQGVGGDGEMLSAHSNAPTGARALMLWLREMGYRPTILAYRPFQIEPDQPMLFALYPTDTPKEEHIAKIRSWVEHGGTLVVVPSWNDRWLHSFGVDVLDSPPAAETAIPLQPISAPAVDQVSVETPHHLRLTEPTWVPLLEASAEPRRVVAATRALGRGRIYVLASWHLLSNDGLRDPGNAAFTLHLLNGIPIGSRIVFDEYHHGYTEYGTFPAQLLREPWGWALLYAGAVCLAYFVMSGQRFGSALPPATSITRRARAEYVTTVAGLLRSRNHRDWLQRQYVTQVRQALGRRFNVRADLPVPEFVTRIGAQQPEAEALEEPLRRLEGQIRDDATLIRLIRQVEAVRARLLGLRSVSEVERHIDPEPASAAGNTQVET